MKRTIVIILLFGLVANLKAQSNPWTLTGNSNASSSNFIGTTNLVPLNIKTNNSTRLYIPANTSHLGIGTTSPQGNLHLHSTDLPSYSAAGLSYTNFFRMTNTMTGGGENDGFVITQNSKTLYMEQKEAAALHIFNNGKGITIDTGGRIGVNTLLPRQQLHVVDGNILLSHSSTRAPGSVNGSILFGAEITLPCQYGVWGIEYVNNDTEGYGLNFWKTWSCGTGFNHALFLSDSGNVGIGTKSPQAKLSVNGNICAKEVRVSLNGSPCWPDYVFEEDYSLTSLKELQKYVMENKHLPDIPSAEEIHDTGVDLGEMNALLLKKIEELTLYIIELEDRINKMEEQGGLK